MAPN